MWLGLLDASMWLARSVPTMRCSASWSCRAYRHHCPARVVKERHEVDELGVELGQLRQAVEDDVLDAAQLEPVVEVEALCDEEQVAAPVEEVAARVPPPTRPSTRCKLGRGRLLLEPVAHAHEST